jgi:hypothetical protein
VYYALNKVTESDAALARVLKEQTDDNAIGIDEVYAFRGQQYNCRITQRIGWNEHMRRRTAVCMPLRVTRHLRISKATRTTRRF